MSASYKSKFVSSHRAQIKRGRGGSMALVSKSAMADRKVALAQEGVRKIRVSLAELQEALEDAASNAIADERAAGPFVRVSLDDL